MRGQHVAEDADRFRGHMLTEMVRMSLDYGLVLQIHVGSVRNHSSDIMARFGRDKGYDIPTQTDYVTALKPLLNAVGGEAGLTIIVFTLDETSFARELAPLAGVYPALKLGPPWWFHESAEGIRRFRETVTETAGFYNTVGFNDDTRAFCSIPARHDVARRVDCAYLATPADKVAALLSLSEIFPPELAETLKAPVTEAAQILWTQGARQAALQVVT
jgi:glucuronate isomerase